MKKKDNETTVHERDGKKCNLERVITWTIYNSAVTSFTLITIADNTRVTMHFLRRGDKKINMKKTK